MSGRERFYYIHIGSKCSESRPYDTIDDALRAYQNKYKKEKEKYELTSVYPYQCGGIIHNNKMFVVFGNGWSIYNKQCEIKERTYMMTQVHDLNHLGKVNKVGGKSDAQLNINGEVEFLSDGWCFTCTLS